MLADRGFYSFRLWQIALGSGARLLWRVSSSPKLPAQQVLADGLRVRVARLGCLAARTRPGSLELQLRSARDQAQVAASRGRPPERFESWRNALLAAIARGRCVSSRGRRTPRGVNRKMSTFNVRHRGAELHRQHHPTPVLRI